MGSRRSIRLPDDLIDRCRGHAQRIVDDYAAGLNARSRSVSSHGAEGNVELQALAKMAECAFCIWARLDPLNSLHWKRCADVGADVQFGNLRVDIKNTKALNKFLIWPVNKTRIYFTKQFDIMVLVKDDFPEFDVAKWITKEAFACHKKIACGDHKLTEGTWYMLEHDLCDMSTLRHWPSI